MNRYRESGAAGLTNARRGKPGTHRIDDALQCQMLTLLRENYIGFGPTPGAEKRQVRYVDYLGNIPVFRLGCRTLEYPMSDKLESVSQKRIGDNLRLGAVLKLAQEKGANPDTIPEH